MKPAWWIRASEIPAYLYCQRSWWLQHVLGLDAEGRALQEGEHHHQRHGRRLLGAERLRSAGLVILLLAVLLLALAWLSRGG